MVAKINVGSSLYGVLAYNQKKIDEMQGRVLFTNRMFESEDGDFNIHRCLECFEMQLPQDIRTEKPIIHISLNPHPDDKLNDVQLSEIAQEYMDKLGYGGQPYIVYKHEDINRHHIHIVSLRVDEHGRKLNDKFEHRRSKDITREIENKYGLHPAEKIKDKELTQFQKVDYESGDIKKQISNTVKGVMSSYRFQSFGEFKTLLSLYNIHAEEVKGEVRGRPYHGIVYSATDDDGNKQGNPIKSSLIGKSVGITTINKKVKQTSEIWKKGTLRPEIKNTVHELLNSSTSISQFKNNLNEKGIDVVIRQNNEVRIYGVTFIDHNNRIALNGSRLGKAFSANAINNLFQDVSETGNKTTTLKEMNQRTEYESPEYTDKSISEHQDKSTNKESLIGDIIKMIFGKSGYHDDDYSNSTKRNRKKKRRYGRQI